MITKYSSVGPCPLERSHKLRHLGTSVLHVCRLFNDTDFTLGEGISQNQSIITTKEEEIVIFA